MTVAKGIGMPYIYPEDLTRMKASWYYDWSSSHYDDPRYVPMSRNGDDPNLPLDYAGYILLFNEPNNVEPFGHPIPATSAAFIYAELQKKYHLAKWVVGNVNVVGGWNWLDVFNQSCKILNTHYVAPIWGIHCYIEGYILPECIMAWMKKLYGYLGGEFWVTEWADTTGSMIYDNILLNYFKANTWITRQAYFTNRAKGDEGWFPRDWKVQLFDWDTGELTNIGKWYATR
jgi:hypothetical protein